MPRYGIQNDKTLLATPTKLELIRRATEVDAARIEVTSFINPKRVPQMADADAVAAALPRGTGRHIGLALNRRGFDRAVASGLDEANFVVVASDTFNLKNQGVTIAAAFGCPFEGEVPLARLMAVLDACVAAGPVELALADMIGVATPRDVTERVGEIRRAHPAMPIRLHLHNTRHTGIANAWVAIEAGARALDASFGGVGECPFAPRATGNIATEDLLYMLDRSGVKTGMDLDKSIAAAEWLQAQLGHAVPGMVMKAGGFPNKAA